MEAELLKELDDETWDAVSALVSLCNAVDHTSYDTDLDGDFYYIIRNDDPEESGVEEELFAVLSGYLLGETIDGKQVLEIEAFTHPAMRQIGMFRMCYQSLLDDFRGYRIRFMIKRPIAGDDEATPFVAPDTYETLRALGATHQYDELFMVKELAASSRAHVRSRDGAEVRTEGSTRYHPCTHRGPAPASAARSLLACAPLPSGSGAASR